jgi:hypothetical protein
MLRDGYIRRKSGRLGTDFAFLLWLILQELKSIRILLASKEAENED